MDFLTPPAIPTAGAAGLRLPDGPGATGDAPDLAAMRDAAEAFEAAFLGEMLSMAGLGKTPEAFGGGVGEEAFGDFLAREYASTIASSRSTGIAEQVFQSLQERAR